MITRSHLLRGLTAFSLLAPLASVASDVAFENGFYYGLKIGAQHVMASWEQSSSLAYYDDWFYSKAISFEFTTGISDQHGQAYHTNLMGNLGVGYAWMKEKYFLAAELSINLAEEQEFGWQETQTVSFDTTVEVGTLNTHTTVALENPDIIFDLRPGWLLAKNFVLYLRGGVAFNKLSMEQNATSLMSDSNPYSDIVEASASESKNVFAWRAGLGMEYKFTPNLALNIDYVFTDYGSIDSELSAEELHEVAGGDDFFFSSTNASSTADVTKSTATAGFNWYFGGRKPKPAYQMVDK